MPEIGIDPDLLDRVEDMIDRIAGAMRRIPRPRDATRRPSTRDDVFDLATLTNSEIDELP